MKKARFIAFLLLGFFIQVSANGGNTACDKCGNKIAPVLTHSYAYTITGDGSLPTVLARPDCCVPPASNPNKGPQKVTGNNVIYFLQLIIHLQGPVQTCMTNKFLQQKRYLFYIYPSHNFW